MSRPPVEQGVEQGIGQGESGRMNQTGRHARRDPADGGEKRPPSQNEIAYRRIKQDILTMRLEPGEYVNEQLICSELNIGRTPVHQAFHRLMHENLVRIVPRKGVIVQPLSLDEFIDLVEVRRINEPVCAAMAARNATDDEIALLDRIMAEVGELRDIGAIISWDRRFHDVIAAAARNRVMAGVLAGLHDRAIRFWALALSAHLADVVAEHADIVLAIRQRDERQAAAAMERHIDSLRDTVAGKIGLRAAPA